MKHLICLVSAAVLILTATRASAHETLHKIERGKAIAVKAYFADGEVLAYTAYEIYSPADLKIPYQKGRTDREGWLAFVPSSAGKWRVKVINDTGHGLDIEVDATATSVTSKEGGANISSIAFILRPLIGLLVIGAVFAILFIAYRRRRTAK